MHAAGRNRDKTRPLASNDSTGLELKREEDIDKAIIKMLCQQYRVSKEVLRTLVEKRELVREKRKRKTIAMMREVLMF